MQIEILIEQSAQLLEQTSLQYRRYMYEHIRWNNRLIGVKGARGTGKTTLLLQWLKLQELAPNQGAYFSLDDLFFVQNTLVDTARAFIRQGGKVLVLDEVHKYPGWAREIKNLYDFQPGLQIIFTGSSILDLARQEGDLSRRALMYELPGLSYREFLNFKGIVNLESIQLQLMLTDPKEIRGLFPKDFRPLAYFKEYLERGYYPFSFEDPPSTHHRIRQLIRTIVEYDMAELDEFDIRNAKKMLHLLYLIAQQVPFKPNLKALAEKTNIHRNTLNGYLYFLEQAKLLSLLHSAGKSLANLPKPEKIYLENSNLMYALAEGHVEIGAIRETFFLSQLRTQFTVEVPKAGDFWVDKRYTFEIGGKKKSRKQVRDLEDAWVVRDDMEFPVGKNLPLWLFGMLY